MKRKISFVFAAAIAILSLTGCGSSGNTSSTENASDEALSQREDNGYVPSIFDNWTEEEEAETASEEYPSMFDVLPYIDVTSVSQFKYEYSGKDGGMAITEYKGTSPKVRIPDTIDGEPVVTADLGDADITELIIPDSLKSLTCNNTYLQYCNISQYVSPANGGENINQVYIPYGVTKIVEQAFCDCTGLTSVTIPGSVTEIGYSAFYGCTGLTYVTIPNGVTGINDAVFSGCTGLKSVAIPASVTEIGGNAFQDCTGLTSVTIPDSVTIIWWSVFEGCTGLTSVTIPNSVTYIGSSAFEGCTGLTTITIPGSVTEIARLTFKGCTGLTSVTIPDSVTEIDKYAFYGCTALTSVTIPDSVTEIGDSAFDGCTNLTSVTIPDSVTYIRDGRSAFDNKDHSAFLGCENIKATYKGKTYTYDNIDELYDAVNNSNN